MGIDVVESGSGGGAEYFRFEHAAMATTFEILVVDESETYARQAARAAFGRIDQFEIELTRFDPCSDISQINHLQAGQSVRVGFDTFACLKIADRMHRETAGAFDAAVGTLLDCWRGPGGSDRQPSDEEIEAACSHAGMDKLNLNAGPFTVSVEDSETWIDLGGIGKGYALDEAAEVLREWSIETALLHCHSTMLAMGALPGREGWPLSLGAVHDPENTKPKRILLKDEALSGSGTAVKGQHIINPRDGRRVNAERSAWARHETAALADALTTALMVMSEPEIEAFFGETTGPAGLLAKGKGA
ncbi:MAG: FAD:protein FMN transferase, partial [Proteobacteria bacterium]|nr:FAD:protein FMN transferase [Pseudomonadota bacterium]